MEISYETYQGMVRQMAEKDARIAALEGELAEERNLRQRAERSIREMIDGLRLPIERVLEQYQWRG